MATSTLFSTAAVATHGQANMVAPFTGLKSASSFPFTRKSNHNITSIANNGGRVQCMKEAFVYRENHRSPGYYDGRYWTMWKLPMFGCTDSSQVLAEPEEAKKEHPCAHIRSAASSPTSPPKQLIYLLEKRDKYS